MSDATAVLRLVCTDRAGLVADVSGLLFRSGANVLHADQHLDREVNTFFQRIEFSVPALSPEEQLRFHRALAPHFDAWGMRWSLRFRGSHKPKVAILASKRGHCPLDLLFRHKAGELECDIPVILSNHRDLEEEVVCRGYRFVHEPILQEDKRGQEQRLTTHLENNQIELVVLARYMQILSPEFVTAWAEKIINIHHSFLPAFAGAEPYRQAYRKGVKLIGATSHYVTAQLDQGPIIAQDVVRVSHRDSVEEMERKGRDIERVVLAHAVRCHLQDRIIAYGNKTVVFE